ncbi:hypothetical protein T4D_16709 [Trichinella pseudospiralis]|uniref:Uncharacterized protein n=1 Tax=Trichinella pseudospiralis TaxID=6337 RepID=A0A0V1EUH2_TRIPS|nr:hypothetical protein T4D_16709 [Trichinella pseudospiralis]
MSRQFKMLSLESTKALEQVIRHSATIVKNMRLICYSK